METVVAFQAYALVWLFAIAAVACFSLALCWALNRKWRARQLDDLRARYAAMAPSDPDYSQVRALYTSLAISAHAAEVYAVSADDGQASSDGAGSDSGGGDGGGSGGD